MEWRKIPTDKHVYGTIYREHHRDLIVFSTMTDLDGQFTSRPTILTEWGFKGLDYPIIGSETTYDSLDENKNRINEQTKYWLCVGIDTKD